MYSVCQPQIIMFFFRVFDVPTAIVWEWPAFHVRAETLLKLYENLNYVKLLRLVPVFFVMCTTLMLWYRTGAEAFVDVG